MAGILYVCGGRSFRTNKLGRKLASVAQCWRDEGLNVIQVCGGDIINDSIAAPSNSYGSVSYHEKWYRKVGLFAPLIRSVSEHRDIVHDALLEEHLANLCKQWKPDVIWERSCRLHSAGLKTARNNNIPYVLEWKDNIAEYWLSLYRNRARRLEVLKNQSADYIVVESEVIKRILEKEGVDSKKIIVAHNAVFSEEFSRNDDERGNIRNSLNLTESDCLVGYLGSYTRYHNTELLVKAMNVLKERGLGNIHCLMVGQGKEFKNTLNLAAKLGLAEVSVTFFPGVEKEKVAAVMSALDVAVLPGSTELICPIKIMEYMAAGLPTLAPDYECNKEIIVDGVNGILFSAGSEIDLADKIQAIANNDIPSSKIASNAINSIQEKYTWKATWGNAIRTVLRSAPSHSA